MGCCQSKDEFADEDDEVVAFEYCPTTGCIVPVRRSMIRDRSAPRSRADKSEPSSRQAPASSMAPASLAAGTSTPPMMSPRNDEFPVANMDASFAMGMSCSARGNNTFTNDDIVDAMMNASMAGPPPQIAVLTTAQVQFVHAGESNNEKLLRLEEVEEVHRSEIYGAFLVTSKMLDMARRKVRPTLRSRPSQPTTVIHHKHVDPMSDAAVATQQSGEKLYDGPSPDSIVTYSPRAEDPAETPRAATPPRPSPEPAPAHNARLEFLDLSGRAIPRPHKSKCEAKGNAWDFLSDPKAAGHLSQGNSYFGFLCKPYPKCEAADIDQLATIVNLSGFKDETVENNVPVVDARSLEEMKKYTIVMVKAMYVLPGFDLSNMNRDLMASLEYQKACQPGSPKFWDDCHEPYTFRSTKALVRFVYSIVIQLRVFEISDPKLLDSFATLDGLRPEKAILLERTKRDKNKLDSTLKCKSILLYYRIDGGTLVTNITTIVNTSVPRVIASLVDSFGSSGAKDVADTATMTSKYLLDKFGDTRAR